MGEMEEALCNKMNSSLDMDSLNKLFTPSDWSKRYPMPKQVISEHITFTKTGKNCTFIITV